MKQIHNHVISFLLLFSCLVSSGQVTSEHKDNYAFFDAVTGIENSDLHYGKVYEEKHPAKNKKTKFFPKSTFVLGSVVFNGQHYFDIPLKYNVYDDELLMLVDQKFEGKVLQILKKQVHSFQIDEHFFIKIDATELENGFYEVALKSPNFLLFKKHRKSIKDLLDNKLAFYEFEDKKKDYFLHYKNSYYSIRKVSNLISIFSKYKTELKSFDKNQDSNLPFDNKLENLLKYLDTLLSSENDKM